MATRAPNQYDAQREKLAAYFDGTARKAWIDLTSDAKVSGIRATVRAGRDEMRSTLLDWLPADMRRGQLLDAGCGTGALSMEAACRGAEVTAIDIAAGLVEIARQRADTFHGHGRIRWKTGDMLDPALGEFDHIVAMDSLIHYQAEDIVDTLTALSERARHSILFTFAPYTKMLGTMHKVGKLFPRSDRSPAIVPVAEGELRDRLSALKGWRLGRSQRVSSGFYTSQALELVKG
ncbi:magnesium protoporphyrin IX methyltransferase [Aurantiacibacter sediminis]|uniref:Magnesium protoporphyrin IX methyltransferase n=1 Tax=Aurantiacibacter sediminis TaxID=2793064 RepID=A0ABS0N1X7_9SPHN|nr:magnesium protoporphyrin IX methyltransferase [Aurantiacibacter sediminis]MBH5321968.1 magnesium protoporphyrin IX methyltransferase [Aurantiacibacter sediminis]